MHHMTIDYTVHMYVQTERGFDRTPEPLGYVLNLWFVHQSFCCTPTDDRASARYIRPPTTSPTTQPTTKAPTTKAPTTKRSKIAILCHLSLVHPVLTCVSC